MTTRALSFGQVADDYDRYRPGYPDALYAAVLAPRMLEAGAGTGRATLALAQRGANGRRGWSPTPRWPRWSGGGTEHLSNVAVHESELRGLLARARRVRSRRLRPGLALGRPRTWRADRRRRAQAGRSAVRLVEPHARHLRSDLGSDPRRLCRARARTARQRGRHPAGRAPGLHALDGARVPPGTRATTRTPTPG